MPRVRTGSPRTTRIKVSRVARIAKSRGDLVNRDPSIRQSDVRPLPVVLGIDFGTSSTKAVIRVPHHIGSPTYAVPLADMQSTESKLSKYILPTRVFVDREGQCFLDSDPNLSTFSDLKTNLMSMPSASGLSSISSAIVNSTAYIALVLRKSLHWFDSSQKQIFGRFTLNWMINMGLPAAVDDNKSLRNRFELVARAAWLTSVRPGNISISQCQQAISDVRDEDSIRDQRINAEIELIPEVIAQAIGYAKSQPRNDGLHLLVDVGAGTLDVCSFNLYRDDDEFKWPVLTADVQPLGTIHLHGVRMKAANRVIDEHFRTWRDVTNPMTIFPNSVEDYLPNQGAIRKGVWKSQCSLVSNFQSMIGSTIIDLKRRRYPNSPAWSESLPVFVCGGGAGLGPYRDAIYRISKWMKEYFRCSQGLRSEKLPPPDGIMADLDRDSYHRLSVAYGLSYPPYNIGKYTSPKEITDIELEFRKDSGESSRLGASEHGGGDKEVE